MTKHSSTLTSAAKQLRETTGSKHTACLRAIEQADRHATDPVSRLEMAANILAADSERGSADATQQPALEPFDVEAWWGSGKHLGIVGLSGSGKTELVRRVAADLLHRGVDSWAVGFTGIDTEALKGLVLHAQGPEDLHALASIVHTAATATGERALFIENFVALDHLDTYRGSPAHPERELLQSVAEQVRTLLEDTPEGLRIIGCTQGLTSSDTRQDVTGALLGGADKIALGKLTRGELAIMGMDPVDFPRRDIGSGIYQSERGQTTFGPCERASDFRAGHDWNTRYRPLGYRAQRAPIYNYDRTVLEVGDRLRFYGEKRSVWTVRAVADDIHSRYGWTRTLAVATTTLFGNPSYCALSTLRGIRGPHDSWGHGAVTDEDCVRTAAALASGEIDFSARNSVRLDLRSVERDGKIIWSDEV